MSQVNMRWNNMPCHHIISFFHFFSDHEVMNGILVIACHDEFTCCKGFFSYFVNKNIFTPFEHDVHVCVFNMMYMFVNYICTKCIKAYNPSNIEPKTSWKHTKILTTKPFQHFINKYKKFNFIMFGMKLFRKFKL